MQDRGHDRGDEELKIAVGSGSTPSSDGDPELHLDAVCRTASALFRVPIVLVPLAEGDDPARKAGSGAGGATSGRHDAFVAHTIAGDSDGPVVIRDLLADPRYADHPLVTGALRARFYAGVPLAFRPGTRIGMLCLIDIVPRPDFTDEHLVQLEDLALIVTGHLRLHEANAEREAELRERLRVATVLARREAHLEAALASQRMAEEIAGFGHWRIDVAAACVEWSAGMARIHGRAPADPARLPLDEHLAFYHPQDRERVRWHLDDVATGSGAFARDDYQHRSRIIRPDGDCRVVAERGIVERDPAGVIRAISGICLDVTELARSDQHLRETTDLLRVTLESIDEGLVMVDPDDRVRVHNERLTLLLDLPQGMLHDGVPFDDLRRHIAERDGSLPATLDRRTRDAKRDHGEAGASGEHLQRDGTLLELCGVPLADGSTVYTFADITARQKAERSLRESEASYRLLADFLPQMVWITNARGDTTFRNRHCGRYYEWPPVSVTERLDSYHPDDRSRVLGDVRDRHEAWQDYDFEIRIRRADGVYRWHKVSKRPIRLLDGEPGWLATALDIDDIITARIALERTGDLLRLAQDAAEAGVWEWDLVTGRIWQSQESARMQGLPLDEADPAAGLLMTMAEWERNVPAEDLVGVRAEANRAIATRTNHKVEFRVLHPSTGECRWFQGFGRAVLDPRTGEVCRFVGMNLDITARKESEEAVRASDARLRVSEERLALALDSGRDGLWDADFRTGEVLFSDRAQNMLGYVPGEFGTSFAYVSSLIHPDDLDGCRQAAIAHFEGRRPAFEIEIRLRTKAEGYIWLHSRGKVVTRAPDGTPIRFVGTYIDITARKEADQRIAHLACHDALTGLPNRSVFHDRLEQALGSVRNGGGAMALLCLDLDRFKAVNDTFGHLAGDTLLTIVAERLRAVLRPCDVVSRLGGDEFGIILVDLGRVDEAVEVARRVIDAIAQPVKLDGYLANIGISIGIAHAPADGLEADPLLRHADLALYRAKAAGRNTVRVYEASMDAAIEARIQLGFELREAIQRGDLTLHYQPVVDLATNTVSGVEALMRWPHPSRGMIPPSTVVEIAEETGLIVELGHWALQEACREAASWTHSARIAVNVSAMQFREPGLEESVIEALSESGLAADRLELEITESVLIQDTEAVIACLHRLRYLGVRIALDDFGTGYSSLSYLRQFPFDKIKIDRSFIREIADADTAAIVRAIVGLGERRGTTITAEGVETRAQLDLVRAEGCNEVQGFFFSKPVPARDLSGVVARLSRAERAA
ncbi:EAL domain-containing protein [Methylobacterium sp. E-045]|uniref:EAL domain-containing protein n=1 Tax=Methylobacterium sp. E-045 TaxID=2836575 RepID=UPI001FBA65A1|nr:EAL domain-containing protein [Methylobacterium sp. E-045]MCJ2129996.1 EAL domain-containing protein [Methylobacterium sp. E-045]